MRRREFLRPRPPRRSSPPSGGVPPSPPRGSAIPCRTFGHRPEDFHALGVVRGCKPLAQDQMTALPAHTETAAVHGTCEHDKFATHH